MTPHHAAKRAMVLTLAFDLLVASLSMMFATVIIWGLSNEPFPRESFGLATLAFLFSAACGFILRGVQKFVWRHMGRPDAIGVLQAVGLSALIYLPGMLMLNGNLHAPWSTLALAVTLWIIALFAGRMFAINRTTKTPLQLFGRVRADAQPAILIGDSDSCAAVLRNVQSNDGANVRILGIVETDVDNPGRAIRGVTVMGGIAQLNDVLEVLKVRYGQAPWLAMTGAARSRKLVEDLLEAASKHGAQVMALSPNEESLVLERVRPADLLSRRERQLDPLPIAKLAHQASILVTGGGGTIGSELARQLASFGPKRLTIVDASEFNLYAVDRELGGDFKQLDRLSKIGDVRDEERLKDVFRAAKPDVVLHAAALKHVPLMENNVCEALLTNVLGAMHAARSAADVGANRFVFISTDKAVDPDNVMGATKRLAELAIARELLGTGVALSMVRFGNVLGSSGSVVPLFEEQIRRGGPVTLTDIDVTRYFMTVDEASALVLQAAALHDNKDEPGLFVLDMGEPIRIRDLAETMIRLKGKVPYRDIKIEVTGLRAGEKLHECLTYSDEAVTQTKVDGVMRVHSKHARGPIFDRQLAALIEAAQQRRRDEALRLLSILVPEYEGQHKAGENRDIA